MAAAPAGPSSVSIGGFAFGPGSLTVKPGEKVTWTNGDDSPHQVTVVGTGQRTELLLKGQSATLQFDAEGNIADICGLHPTMKGTIVVAR